MTAPPPPSTLRWEVAPCPCRAEHAPRPPYTHVHHVHPLGEGGPDDDANTVPLCPAAHDWVHLILRAFDAYGGIAPRRSDWPHHPYAIASRGWARMVEAGVR